MSGAKRMAPQGCRRHDELEMKLANGLELTARERAEVEQHLAECQVCGALARALEVVRQEPDGSGLQADELAARRVIGAAMDEAWPQEHAGSEGSLHRGDSLASPRRAGSVLRTVWISAAVAALTALGVAALIVHGQAERAPLRSGGAVARADGQARRGEVTAALVAGEARLAGAVVMPGERLASGGELRVGAGRVALRMGSRVAVLLSSGTRVRLAGGSRGAEGLRLLSGELLVSVDPGPGLDQFAVRVDERSVLVTGTIFSVSKGAGGVRVSVLRGAVEILGPAGVSRRLTRGWTRLLGARSAEAIDGGMAKGLWRRARLLALLRGLRSAHLSVRTEPSGARVRLDGLLLGVTPLDALVAEGQRELELELDGFTPVHERLLLGATAEVERDFKLVRLRPRPSSPPEPVGPAGELGGAGAVSGVGWRELLRVARSRRAARSWRKAATAYKELIERFPGVGAARAAMVSRGLILLEHLRQPAAALRSFERYLSSGGGALAPEAEWGRIRALGALGRRRAEAAALRRFLRRHKGSARARGAARRLRELVRGSQVRPSR